MGSKTLCRFFLGVSWTLTAWPTTRPIPQSIFFLRLPRGESQTGVPESQLRVANSLKEWTGLQLQYPQHTRKLAGPNGLPGFQLRGSVDG